MIINIHFTILFLLQTAALDILQSSNPDGRFWIKLDATDIKVAVMESARKVWNGDMDLGDGQLEALRQEYNERIALLDGLKNNPNLTEMRDTIPRAINQLEEDTVFLEEGFKHASETFQKKFNQANCPEETLKESNWDVVEFQTLLQQSQQLKFKFEEVLSSLVPDQIQRGNTNFLRMSTRDLATSTTKYLRNVFKKKRKPATHVMVTMLSDEKRAFKPYALPVQYIPCQTLRDQFVRDLNRNLKAEMASRNMKVAGTVQAKLYGVSHSGK